MLRGHPGIDGDFGNELLEFLLAHLFHHSAFHGFGAGGEDADLLGDGRGGDHVVAGDHHRPDAGGNTFCHSLLGLLPRGVHHGDEAQEEEVVLVLQGDLHGLHPAAGEGQHPEALLGEGLVDPLNLLPLSGAQEGAVQEHVHGALGHEHVPPGELVEGGHELPVGVKGELPQPGPVLPDVQLVEAEVLPQPDQGGLGGVADLPLLVHGGVAAQQGRPEEGFLDGVLEVRLGGGDHPAAHIELADGHLVLGEGARLVRADDGHGPQPLHRLELADDGVLLGHLPGAEGQHDGDDGAQRLRDSRHRQGHGEEEGVHNVLPPHQDAHGKEDGAEHQDADGELLAKVVQAHLEGGLFLRGSFQEGGNFAHLRLHPRASDQEAPPAIGDEGPGEHHVLPVPQGDVIGLDGGLLLFHWEALAGEGALGGFQAGALQQAAVGAHGVPGLQHHHVPGDHLPAGDLEDFPVPDHLSRGGGHLFEAVQRRLGLDGLHRAQDGVHGDDRQDDHHALHIPQHRRDHRGKDQDDHQEVGKLFQENPNAGFLAALLQLVGAVLLQALLGLPGGEPLGPAAEAVQQVLAGPLPDLVWFLHSVLFLSHSRTGVQKSETFRPPCPAQVPKVSPFQTAAGPTPVY